MTLNGVAYELPTWEPATDVSASSSLLLTPVASEGLKPSSTMGVARRLTTGQPFLTNQIVTLCGLDPSEGPLFKTPTSQLAVNGGSQHPDKRRAGGHGPTLADEVEHLLPTPTVGMMLGGSETRSGARSTELLLPGVAKSLAPTYSKASGAPVNLLPTPQAHDAQKGKTAEQVARMRAKGHGVANLNEVIENGQIGGITNQRSAAGSEPLDGQLPGQQNLLDAIAHTD
jgi:hypothetical protein